MNFAKRRRKQAIASECKIGSGSDDYVRIRGPEDRYHNGGRDCAASQGTCRRAPGLEELSCEVYCNNLPLLIARHLILSKHYVISQVGAQINQNDDANTDEQTP